MVILKNIVRSKDSISTDYYPEGKAVKGFMEISRVDGGIIKHSVASAFVAPHVKRELERLAKLEEPPKEKMVYWY